MEKFDLSLMTFTEFEERARDNPPILIPMGSTEEHGPQNPMGDYLMSQQIARMICERSHCLMTPPIPFSYSEYFRNFPGTITVQAHTLAVLVEDICHSLIRHGLDHLIFFNGHRGNAPILEQIGRKLRAETGVLIAEIIPWEFITADFIKELYGADANRLGHGSEYSTSLAMYLTPEGVNMDLAEQGTLKSDCRFGPFEIKTGTKVKVGQGHATLYLNYDEIVANGVIGDPFIASADKGEKMVARIVEHSLQFIELFEQLDTRVAADWHPVQP